jgi:hypothetical protein
VAAPALCAVAADDIGNGFYWLELRPRYNRIEETDYDKVARGGTLRAVAGWTSPIWRGFRVSVEGIYAEHFASPSFNDDPSKFDSEYPLLPDPRHTGVNRAYVEWSGSEDWVARLGRLKVAIDNGRWVSDNDFRQIPQLFDGGNVAWRGLPNTELSAGYYRKLRDTSGETDDMKLTTLHAAWNPAPGHSISAYGYFHDQAVTPTFTGFSNNSYKAYGVRAEGTAARVDVVDILYEAEVAQQKPYAGGDARIDARYWRVGGGAGTRDWTVRADYEVRGSNNGQYGLQMPLTDFYAFNGWTLNFFVLPREGLRDRWLTGRWRIAPVTLYAETHRFRSDFGGLDFGHETDASATWEIVPNATLRLQYARYESGAGQPENDIRKTWLTLSLTYP